MPWVFFLFVLHTLKWNDFIYYNNMYNKKNNNIYLLSKLKELPYNHEILLRGWGFIVFIERTSWNLCSRNSYKDILRSWLKMHNTRKNHHHNILHTRYSLLSSSFSSCTLYREQTLVFYRVLSFYVVSQFNHRSSPQKSVHTILFSILDFMIFIFVSISNGTSRRIVPNRPRD